MLGACRTKEKSAEGVEESGSDESFVTLTAAQYKNAGIVTGKAEQKEISSILKLNGKVDVPPQNMVSISVPLGGYLKNTQLLPGMHVSKGDVIATVEDQQYIQLQQDYLTARARIGFLENEYRRQKDLNATQAVSDKVYQQAESDYRTQRILISALSEKLKLAGINVKRISETNITRSISIHSPINGFVSKVNVNIGKYVSPTEVLFELINPADIHLSLTVFEKNLDKIYTGQKLFAFTNNQPGKKHACEIILIGKNLSMNGNTEVHCHFEDYDKTLVPGTYMNAEIEERNSLGMALPTEAIVRFENKQYAYRAAGNNRFEMLEVTAGETQDGFTRILSAGQNDPGNTTFVVKGAYSLLMLMKNKAD
jgi:membrane fusion protein, heavy metal efflux system